VSGLDGNACPGARASLRMSRTALTAIEHALDHVRRAASAAGCLPGPAQDVARRLRAEQVVLERLIESADAQP
jgi:hypothetical protein